MSRLFVGSAICQIASDGVLTLPGPFLSTVTARGTQDELHVGLHDQLNCLIMFDHVVLNERIERCACDQVVGVVPDATDPLDRLRRNLGFAAPAPVDATGRLIIAPWLDERRGEARHLLLVGMGHSVEAWDLDYVVNHGQRDLRQLANLHLDLLNAQSQPQRQQGASHEVSLPYVGSRRGALLRDQSGFPVQPLCAVQPRHDPIDGVTRR